MNQFSLAVGYSLISGVVLLLVWERQRLLRNAWAHSEKIQPMLVESQRNAAHDIRNALFEVIALVEIAGTNSNVAPPLIDEIKKAMETSKEVVEEKLEEKLEEKQYDPQQQQQQQQIRTTSAVSSQLKNEPDKIDVNKLSLHVRNVTSRIIHRLDASLRDGRAVVQKNPTRLNPQILSCNLRLIMEEDLALDDLVRLTISKDFPQTVETDVPWIRTIVQNLVHNAKKHGPRDGIILVHMKCSKGEASIEVTDEGNGIDPAKAREVFDPKWSQSNGIGLRAVRTYCLGLGGTCGAFKSTFWVKFPSGQVNGLTMNLFSFHGARAERIFRVRLAEKISPTLTALSGIAYIVILQLYFNIRKSTGGVDRPFVAILLSLFICYFVFQRAYHGKHATVQAVNDDIDGIVGDDGNPRGGQTWFCCRCLNGKYYVASHEKFFIMFGNRLCILFVAFDLINCVAVIYNYEGMGVETWTPATVMITLGFTHLCRLTNLVVVRALPTFVFMFITRIAIVIASPTMADYSYRSIHVLWLIFAYFCMWSRERELRINYSAGYMNKDLIKDRQNLELSSQVKKQEIERQAIREAKHMISECFDTLLKAAQRLLTMINAQEDGKEENNGNGNGNGIHVTCSKSELRLCSDMIQSAQRDYISLQKKNQPPPLSINQVVVDINKSDSKQDSTTLLLSTPTAGTTITTTTTTTTTTTEIDENSVQKGSTTSGGSSSSSSSSNSSKKSRTVLVVDDNLFCREFVASQIRNLIQNETTDSQVNVTGEDAQKTLNYLLNSTFDYDLVLMDMNMPGSPVNITTSEAGLWVTKQYKKERRTSLTKFVCVSGLGRDKYLQERCRAAGMAKPYALGKPFEPEELLELMVATFGVLK